ncbi:hypothetical protein VTK26DRAFT_3631 [Humicola hyalothermophila]
MPVLIGFHRSHSSAADCWSCCDHLASFTKVLRLEKSSSLIQLDWLSTIRVVIGAVLVVSSRYPESHKANRRWVFGLMPVSAIALNVQEHRVKRWRELDYEWP